MLLFVSVGNTQYDSNYLEAIPSYEARGGFTTKRRHSNERVTSPDARRRVWRLLQQRLHLLQLPTRMEVDESG
ncbi:MAG: hypothetical protein ACLVEJ_12405 [Parabacteroides sp.]